MTKNSSQPTIADRIAETTVLIPAAGRVAEGLMALSNIACPAMVPVAGRPVIYWTMSYLRSLGLRNFVIAVSRRGLTVEDFVECTFGKDCNVNFVVPANRGGVVETIQELAHEASGTSSLVVLGDTYFQFSDPDQVWTDEPAVLVGAVEDSDRWCVVKVRDGGYVEALHDKQPELPSSYPALIGVYYFPRTDRLRSATAALIEKPGCLKRAEISDVLRHIAIDSGVRALPAGDWLDCGNPDRQASSHRALLQKRAFNDLRIDTVFGTITKRSRNVEKFLDEINYLRLLPPEMAVLFPRVVESSTDWSDPFLTMEYYGYPTLAEAFVFENVNPGMWEQIFLHLREIIVNGFMLKRRPLTKAAIRNMYLEKTRERLDELRTVSQTWQERIDADYVVINGRPLANLRTLWPRIEEDTGRLENNAIGCLIHGDLCLSNILYDLRSRIVKFVDPRGSFGSTGTHGDPRYDVAKLYHSIHGLYDFIVNDLFRVSVTDQDIQLDIRSRPQHDEIRRRFEKVFFDEFDRREVLLITALLFASMPALHYDAPHRQTAMYARSLQLFDKLYSPSGTVARI